MTVKRVKVKKEKVSQPLEMEASRAMQAMKNREEDVDGTEERNGCSTSASP